MAKPKRASFPREEFIINCIENNRHGFSFAWNENGTLCNHQTLNPYDALDMYRRLKGRLDPEKSALVFHARIATHGSVGLKNCHCWIEDNIAFAHNGVLYGINATKDRTDSQTYFQDVFIPIKRKYGLKAAYENAQMTVGASRFTFLRPSGELVLMGQWVPFLDIAKGKVLFSNGSFERRSYFEGFASFNRFRFQDRGYGITFCDSDTIDDIPEDSSIELSIPGLF